MITDTFPRIEPVSVIMEVALVEGGRTKSESPGARAQGRLIIEWTADL